MRHVVARALVVVASASIVLALIAAYAQRAVIDSDQFANRATAALRDDAVRDVHRALFDRDRDTVTLTVADVGTVLAAALEQLRPALARKLESAKRVALVERDVGTPIACRTASCAPTSAAARPWNARPSRTV